MFITNKGKLKNGYEWIHWFHPNDYVMFQEILNKFRGVRKHSHFLMNRNLRKRSINTKLFIHSAKIHKNLLKLLYPSYGLWIIRKDESRGIKELLENAWLKRSRDKKKIVSPRFAATENGVQTVKTAIEIESDLITDCKNKLKVDNFSMPDPFKILHGWMEEGEGMAFWPMLSYPDIFNFLMFYRSEL